MSAPDVPSKDEEKKLEAEFHQHITTLRDLTDKAIIDNLRESAQCLQAYTLASHYLPPAIFHHVIRVFCDCVQRADNQAPSFLSPDKLPLLFAACVLHDIGASASPRYNSSERFEIDGADAASELLASHGTPEAECKEVWVAIALHSTPGIAERISELARLVRESVKWDFGRLYGPVEEEGWRKKVESAFPRLEVEKALGDAVTKQAVEKPEKAPSASWPGCLLEAYRKDPEYKGVNPGF